MSAVPQVARVDGAAGEPAAATCRHCGFPLGAGAKDGFCCEGCAEAYARIQGLGLGRYYEKQRTDAEPRPVKRDEGAVDYAAYVATDAAGVSTLHLMVEGLHCPSCVWLIESVLAREPLVIEGRVNMTTGRLKLRWRGGRQDAPRLAGAVAALGYRLVPFDPQRVSPAGDAHERELLRAMAIAGFAAANIMLLSVAVWAGHAEGMGPATRDLMHWISALIALPAIAYAGMPFFRSAAGALAHGRTNMDVPISIGVIFATGMSLVETATSGRDAYFDSAVTLLFFLLIGRYLDRRTRGRARATAENLLALTTTAVRIVAADGTIEVRPPSEVKPGEVVLAAAGERIAVDGRVVEGTSDLDASLVTGETVPVPVAPGAAVFAGMVNLTAPVRISVGATGEGTLLGEIVRLMAAAEQGRAQFVALANRLARLYAPVVHVAALATLLGWIGLAGANWRTALVNAVAVLIITCPCALALAVPVVQVMATGRLLRQGVLVKSATALERLARVDTVVFDKTGTLTLGRPELLAGDGIAPDDLGLAASLAKASRHPLAVALASAAPAAPAVVGVREHPGQGLSLQTPAREVRLGNRAFCGIGDGASGEAGSELWLVRPGVRPVRFAFADRLREDAAATLAGLAAAGYAVQILSGDHAGAVAGIAARVGVTTFVAAAGPTEKCATLERLRREGRTVLMVGDGLNDAPALAAAHVSMSPSTAIDASQTAADVVFQGPHLKPVLEVLDTAQQSDRVIRQNLALALIYNLGAVPLAVLGYVTPLLAAIAMSSSSLIVIGNAARLSAGRKV